MGNSLKILLVEDSRLDAEMFSSLVRRSFDFRCEIEVSSSLHEAVCSIQRGTPDLIVLDLNLPDSQGLDTFRQIQMATDTPVVIYSGADGDELTREALVSGAQDYIVKGEVDTHSLTQSMRFAVERSKRGEIERRLAQQETELELLHQIQTALLPSFPSCDFYNASASAVTHPAEKASGDCCDIIPLNNSKFLCYVADVSGHGLRASQLMLSVRSTIRAIAKYTSDPEEIILAADDLLFDDFQHERFVTLIIALVDTAAGTLTHASAAHQGYLMRDSEVLKLANKRTPIGIYRFDAASHQQEVIHLSPGDILFFATDGLVETQNAQEQFFGEERLLDTLRETKDLSPQDTISQLTTDSQEFRGELPQADDITMVTIKYNPENTTNTEEPSHEGFVLNKLSSDVEH